MTFQAYWLLVLPLFFGLGWVAARIDIRHILTESRILPASYFRGLNFLINEQTDQAIEAFIEVARADQQTIELYFVLGNLFRKRGEVDRATRLHKILLDRTDLNRLQLDSATYELGLDYLKAGLLDRAEPLFNSLLSSDQVIPALEQLLYIYVAERNWLKAIEISSLLTQHGFPHQEQVRIHYYCELAHSELYLNNSTEAQKYLTQALQLQKNHPRSLILQGQIYLHQNDRPQALEAWNLLEKVAPNFLFLTAPFVMQSDDESEKNSGLLLLQGWVERHPSIDLLSYVYQKTLEHHDEEEAFKWVRLSWQMAPSLAHLNQYLEAWLLNIAPELRSDVFLMRDLVSKQVQKYSLFQCRHCGFKAKTFRWQCPACAEWDSYPPERNGEPMTETRNTYVA
jgi:lipopolysaccharide biosynthesis regulator YciM